MKYIICNQEDLAKLQNAHLKMSIRSIFIGHNDLQNSRIEKQLNRHYFACGCQSGSVAVLLTLFVSLLSGFKYGFDGPVLWWKILLYMAAAAIAGKAAGLLWSHLRLRSLYRQLFSLLPKQPQNIS